MEFLFVLSWKCSHSLQVMNYSHNFLDFLRIIISMSLGLIFVVFSSIPSSESRVMQMTMMRGSTPGGTYRMMMVERMKKGMDKMMMNQYPAPAPQQQYSQGSQEKPTKVVVVKVQPMMQMAMPKMDDCIVPVDMCSNNMMMPMMYGGGGGDRWLPLYKDWNNWKIRRGENLIDKQLTNIRFVNISHIDCWLVWNWIHTCTQEWYHTWKQITLSHGRENMFEIRLLGGRERERKVEKVKHDRSRKKGKL